MGTDLTPTPLHGDGEGSSAPRSEVARGRDACRRGRDHGSLLNKRWRSVGPASRWLPSQDSNLDAKLQRLLCYRYTTRQGSRVAESSIAGDASGTAPDGYLTRF